MDNNLKNNKFNKHFIELKYLILINNIFLNN
jgi:hypothetical protein